jgi:hypothetical protein
MNFIKRIYKRLTIKKRAQKRGHDIIGFMPYARWTKTTNRNLIRLNRICAGLKPFSWDGKSRKVRDTFECQVSLHSFGNYSKAPTLADSVRDLVAFNNQ